MRQIRRLLRHKLPEWAEAATMLCALNSIAVLSLIVLFVAWEALPALLSWTGVSLTFENKWSVEHEKYGLYVLLVSSLMASMGALAIAIPVGVAAAIFVAEVIPRGLREAVRPLIELLGAIPSVLYGFVGLKVVVPMVQRLFNLYYGQTALTASIVLAVMIVPTIVSLSSEIISAVPVEYREASLALGATKWQTVRHIVLSTAMPGIVASAILAFGRAMGETVAVVMVAGTSTELAKPFWDFLQPIYPMTAAIAMGFGEAEVGGAAYHAYFAIGAILLAFAFTVNLVANLLLRKAPTRVRL